MSQSQASSAPSRADYERFASLLILAVLVVVGMLTSSLWLPALKRLVTSPAAEMEHQASEPATAAEAVAISSQAQESIGVQLAKVQLTDFDRAVSLPGIVAERRGSSRLEVGAPLASEVHRIFVAEGEAVRPGQKLFELRLTHDELVQLQASLLQVTEELDIVQREVARLENVAREGAVAGRSVLERKYEQQKLEATLRVRRQAMLMHTFSQEQIDEILQTRRLLNVQTVRAPTEDGQGEAFEEDRVLQLQHLDVELGQHVDEGATLAMLTDHRDLLIEGDAFERDAPLIYAAWQAGQKVTAVLEEGGETIEIKDLSFSHVANALDPTTRILHFYVVLPNELLSDRTSGKQRFAQWKYKPGQRTINRENVRRRIVIQCNTAGRDLGSVVTDIQRRLDPIQQALPTGYSLELGGQFESQQSATQMIGLLSLVSLAAMFLVLYSLFRSVNLALQVLAALPMAAIGAVAALVITGQSLTVASLVGFISLAGIASRNGILLIAHYLHLVRYEGEQFTPAMIERAGKERLAPMLMTALTAGIALIPLVLAAGEPGKEILYPVATVILGGLISSTLLDFFVHPALFWCFGRNQAERQIGEQPEDFSEIPAAPPAQEPLPTA